ncbi:hypothetical protein SAMN04487895_101570 [Paenibacillus sophorae]|uniref:Uncharacterized protein n=1 Tax=Paenibacillus sophorae TaxID=1333845 RepID=A0A1H8GM54_9BACL|nr:hypothetical protein [Paenibacillus sophorae]QWU14273.1 hypothetical protein KP014_20410 [Paenibacillus sophorae]SEN45076.1 hypothetical protein SAMN04487895_101570 [Paenibacillus sophorae]
MKSSEFEARKSNLRNYFFSDKFQENEYGERVYYKGKRNLKELGYILDLAFGDVYEPIKSDYIKNYEDKIIGGYIIARMFVDADFNGFNQGTAGADVFVKYNLTENSFYMDQSQTLEWLERS